MAEFVLPKSFFDENPLREISAAKLADFRMDMAGSLELSSVTGEILSPHMPQKRLEAQAEDRAAIAALETPADVLNYMRHPHDAFLDGEFYQKVRTLPEDVYPAIVDRFKRSALDRFIEHTAVILFYADPKYTARLLAEYDQIRNPYAKSTACLLFGKLGFQDAAPLLLQEYRRFRRDYPKDSFDQGPLLGLSHLFPEN